MSSIDTSRGIAARLGSWSARHKKSVLAGWFVFVALAMMVSSVVPANTLTKADQFTGESGRAEKTLESSFPKPATELVLVHSGTLTADAPAFKRGVKQLTASFAGLSQVEHLRAPGYRSSTGLVSKDRHTAMIQFEIRGDAEVVPDDDYAFADEVGAKYKADLRAMDGDQHSRVIVTVRPTRVNAVDMSS